MLLLPPNPPTHTHILGFIREPSKVKGRSLENPIFDCNDWDEHLTLPTVCAATQVSVFLLKLAHINFPAAGGL